jgi:hypothetical protein
MSGFFNAVGAFVVMTFDAVICFGLVFVVGRFMVRRANSLVAKAVIIVIAFYLGLTLAEHFLAAIGGLF